MIAFFMMKYVPDMTASQYFIREGKYVLNKIQFIRIRYVSMYLKQAGISLSQLEQAKFLLK